MSVASYYERGENRASKVQLLFTRIARRYDLVNDIQSFGLHRRWKKKVAELVAARPGDKIIDLATGTGDLIRMGRQRQPEAEWFGLDFTLEMMCRAPDGGPMIQADILDMPLRDAAACGLTMAYGMRNISDRAAAMAEMKRVLRPGGRLVFLEFAKPESAAVRSILYAWLRIVQPLLGALFFGEPETYRYILESLDEYPEVEEVSRELRQAGFRKVETHRLFLGAMSIHVAVT